MFELHKELNQKLTKLDTKEDELSFFDIELSNEEFWLLVGRVLGYL
jgi:hypothetical protein